MIRECALIFLGVSSLAFGSKNTTHEEKVIALLEDISSQMREVNSQLHHQTRLIIQLDMIFEDLLEVSKPYNSDWYKEESPKKPSESPQ